MKEERRSCSSEAICALLLAMALSGCYSRRILKESEVYNVKSDTLFEREERESSFRDWEEEESLWIEEERMCDTLSVAGSPLIRRTFIRNKRRSQLVHTATTRTDSLSVGRSESQFFLRQEIQKKSQRRTSVWYFYGLLFVVAFCCFIVWKKR